MILWTPVLLHVLDEPHSCLYIEYIYINAPSFNISIVFLKFLSLSGFFSSSINSSQPNVAKRQFEWSERGFSRKTTAALPSVSASQALIALSEHSTESSQPNFSHRCASPFVSLCSRETCACLSKWEGETDRQR